MNRVPTEQEYCHERLGERFLAALSSYDTARRVHVLVDDFLTDAMVLEKSVLDVGCGLGFFSERLAQRGAKVVACDIGPTLVEKARQRARCTAQVADVMRLTDHFGHDCFDGLVSSECIEHTPDPLEALRQMVMVVKPGGFLSISTPNVLWKPAVKLATFLRLRPFDGHERFSSWRSIRRTLVENEAPIVREFGLHLFPFQVPLHRLSAWCDRHLQVLRGMMINICVLARKQF